MNYKKYFVTYYNYKQAKIKLQNIQNEIADIISAMLSTTSQMREVVNSNKSSNDKMMELTTRKIELDSKEELAKELDVEKEDLVMAMEANFSVEYLHGVIHEEEGSPICLIDKISLKGEDDEEKVIDNILLKEVLGKLEKRERQIIMLRYFEDKTQSEIGDILQISQVQVSRIEKKVLMKLKSYIG